MPIDSDERTEPATPRRREEARTKGQVARSHDLSVAVMLLGAFTALWLFGARLWEALLVVLAASLDWESAAELGALRSFSVSSLVLVVERLAPIVVTVFALGLVVLYGQVGNLFTLQPLTPSLSKIDPIAGFGRLFSARNIVTTAINVAKLVLVSAVAYAVFLGMVDALFHSSSLELMEVIALGGSMTVELGVKLSLALVLLALLDYAWQRYKHERDLRMTKEEVRDELRSMEGDPHIRRRRRQLQLQLAMQRLKKEVPRADVVVTNPTHYAVAIRYDADTMAAPKVVAKGADYLAIRIRMIAREFGVPIIERKPLARALYETVEVGHYVPERFYRAIAEILAYLYELTGHSPLGRERETVGAR